METEPKRNTNVQLATIAALICTAAGLAATKAHTNPRLDAPLVTMDTIVVAAPRMAMGKMDALVITAPRFAGDTQLAHAHRVRTVTPL